MSEAVQVQEYLKTRGLNAFICSVEPGNDIKEVVIEQLDGCKMAVVFGTSTYGRGSVNFSTKVKLFSFFITFWCFFFVFIQLKFHIEQ
jgi:hypothetical protein